MKRKKFTDYRVEPSVDDFGIKLSDRPKGWRIMTTDVLAETDKAILIGYYSWEIWLPKSSTRRTSEGICAPIDVIDNSKAHKSSVKH